MIKLVNVSKFYSSNNVIALGLRKVNLELHRNEFIAIVGESGSGKTTLLNVISGIDSYEDGEMYINGKETSYYSIEDMENYRKKYVAFVFQNYNLIDSYTVLQNVEAPLILSGYSKEKIKRRAKEIIKRVGLSDHINHKATKLSGGQKQRVVIARALAKDCPIIAADEPTGNLDSKSASQIIKLLYEISKEKLVIVVTHDFSQLEEYATRKIRVFDGEIVEDLKLKKTDLLDLPNIPDEEHKIKFSSYLLISLKNLLATPKKTLLMITIFSFFSFFVALSYGGYQLAMNEISYNNNSHFTNTSPNRIVLRKNDNTPFTQTELDDLANYNMVADVMPFDYVLDTYVSLQSNSNTGGYFYGQYLPLSLIDENMLAFGRMPNDKYEVVVSGNQYMLDNSNDFLNKTFQSWNDNGNVSDTTLRVVGIIDSEDLKITSDSYSDEYILVTDDYMSGLKDDLYLSYTITKTINGSFAKDSIIYPFSTDLNYWTINVDNTLNDNQIKTSTDNGFFGPCENTECVIDDVSLNFSDYYTSNEFSNMKLILSANVTGYSTLYVNQNIYDQIFYNDIYQVSIFTNTDVGVESFVNTLQKIHDTPLDYTYKVIYPYNSDASDNFEAILLLLSSIGLIGLIIVTLIGSTLITYVIFRAIINTKLHDYAIFRTIGANKSIIKSFIYLENLYVVLVSYILFVILSLSIPTNNEVIKTILAPLKVYGFTDYLVFLILLIGMSLIISRKYNNRIFRQSVQKTLKTDMG